MPLRIAWSRLHLGLAHSLLLEELCTFETTAAAPKLDDWIAHAIIAILPTQNTPTGLLPIDPKSKNLSYLPLGR